MNMDILELSGYNQRIAWQVVKESNIIEIWKSIGAEINIIGSLKTGLLMKNRDIDFHIYTNDFSIASSFSAMENLAENPSIKEIRYLNRIDTEEECIEWHAIYEDNEMNQWKLDMIHIRKGSKYDGVFERVADAIAKRLTPEATEAILQIKFDMPDSIQVSGVEIYRAVLSEGIRNYKDFMEWRKINPLINISDWMP